MSYFFWWLPEFYTLYEKVALWLIVRLVLPTFDSLDDFSEIIFILELSKARSPHRESKSGELMGLFDVPSVFKKILILFLASPILFAYWIRGDFKDL